MLHIHFYYDIPKQNQNVYLFIDGMNQNLLMTSYLKTNKHYYFYELLLNDSCGYPITLNYQYRLQNGTTLDTKTFTLNYKSVVFVIIIKDTPSNSLIDFISSPMPEPNTPTTTANPIIEIFFFLEIPPPLSSNATSVLILSPFPQLNGNKSMNMMYLKEHNLWASKISIDSSFPMPLIYYYSVKTTQNLYFGENRVRLIEFNSPVNRKGSISIYDYFFKRVPSGSLPFYYHPIEVFTFPIKNNQLYETDSTRFELLFVPEESEKQTISDVGIVMGYDSVVSAKLSKINKFSYWLGIMELANNFKMSTYSLRISHHFTTAQTAPSTVTFNSAINFLMSFDKIQFDSIQTRIVKSDVKCFPLVLYFPLVSLKVGPSNLNMTQCGTFETIGQMAKFLRQTDISVIHVHIEKLPGSEMFLDPVQLDISDLVVHSQLASFSANPDFFKIDTNLRGQIELILSQAGEKPVNLSLNTLREIKLLIVRNDFRMRKNFEAFESFKTVFGEYFTSQIKLTEFEYYVQFVCYAQLFTSVQLAHLNRVQVITDVSVADGIQSTIDSLPVISLYSSGIYFTDVSNIEGHGFSIAQIRERFREDSTFVSSTFCEKHGNFFCVRSEFKLPKGVRTEFGNDLISFNEEVGDLCNIDKTKLMKSLQFIEPSQRQHYFTSLVELNKIEEAMFHNSVKSDRDDMFDRLVHTSKCISAMIILDEKLSIEKVPSNLEKAFILSSFTVNSKKFQPSFNRCYLLPDGLTPLRTSSFLQNADRAKVAAGIKDAFKKRCSLTVVYLNDLLFCCELATLAGHSVVTGNDPDRRDVLHITVDDLVRQKDVAVKRINDFVRQLL